MTVQNYQNLQAASKADNTLLGVALPTLTPAHLAVESYQVDFQRVKTAIADFNATQGWVMYRDALIREIQAPSRSDLIEAEYSNGTDTLTIKLIAHDRYQVSKMTMQNAQGTMLFKTQTMPVQARLGSDLFIIYRLWYVQGCEGETQGKWQPYAQQFIGFTQEQ
jgi:hypothetical protein